MMEQEQSSMDDTKSDNIIVYKEGEYTFIVLSGNVSDTTHRKAAELAQELLAGSKNKEAETSIVVDRKKACPTAATNQLNDDHCNTNGKRLDNENILTLKNMCNICGKKFTRPIRLNRHLKTHSKKASKDNGSSVDVETIPTNPLDSFCGDFEASEDDVKANAEALQDELCHICGKMAKAGRKHQCITVYYCDTCGRVYSRKSRLLEHERVHTGDQPYQCSTCGKLFSVLCNLRRHQRIHTGEKPFACSFCDKRCSQKSELQEHELVHTSERPKFDCRVCGKTYLKRSSARQHELTHGDDRPFVCHVCDKGFVTGRLLRLHTRSHIPIELRPPVKSRARPAGVPRPTKLPKSRSSYVCSTCGMFFNFPASLRVHERLHSGTRPYRCKVCEKTFVQSPHLKQHMRTHTGDKPYTCWLCDKSFAYVGNRDQHVLTHTSVRQYPCEICGKTFALPMYLKRHSKIHGTSAANSTPTDAVDAIDT